MKAILVLMGLALGVLIGVSAALSRKPESGMPQIEILASTAQELQPPTAASPVPTPVQLPAQSSNAADLIAQSPASREESLHAVVEEATATVMKQMRSPEGQAQLRARMRDSLESSYSDIDQELGLTAAEKNELLDLLAMQQVRSMATVAPENESAQDSEARQRRQYETEASELQALLGNKYLDWRDYQEALPVRQQARSLRLRLDAAGIPLTQTQERALINALSMEQRSINQAAPSDSSGFAARYTPEIRQRLLNAATSYLSAEQLDEYEGVLERRAAQEQAVTRTIEPGRR